MATKKKVSKKKGMSAIPSWQQQLAKHVSTGKAPKEKPLTGDFISADGGKMVFTMGGAKLGKAITCVILGWRFENAWHDYDYTQGESYPPTCFSVGVDEDDMIADSTSPDRQGGTGFSCLDCELNEWGSGVGKSKACGNRRRLALVVDADKGKPEIKMLSIPPTSLNNWKKFVEDVENSEIHIMQAVVTISFDEDSTAKQAPLVFEFDEEITDNKILNELSGALPVADKLLDKPNDVSDYKGGKGKKGKKKVAKKKVAKKKVTKKKKSKFS